MRLILTLFALLFTQLFFNLAHAAPQARVAAEQRKAMLMKRGPMTAERKRTKPPKSQSDGPEKNQDRQDEKREKREKIVSAKPKAKAQKTAKIKVTPPKRAIKGYGRHREAGMATAKLAREEKPLKLSPAHKNATSTPSRPRWPS